MYLLYIIYIKNSNADSRVTELAYTFKQGLERIGLDGGLPACARWTATPFGCAARLLTARLLTDVTVDVSSNRAVHIYFHSPYHARWKYHAKLANMTFEESIDYCFFFFSFFKCVCCDGFPFTEGLHF